MKRSDQLVHHMWHSFIYSVKYFLRCKRTVQHIWRANRLCLTRLTSFTLLIFCLSVAHLPLNVRTRFVMGCFWALVSHCSAPEAEKWEDAPKGKKKKKRCSLMMFAISDLWREAALTLLEEPRGLLCWPDAVLHQTRTNKQVWSASARNLHRPEI